MAIVAKATGHLISELAVFQWAAKENYCLLNILIKLVLNGWKIVLTYIFVKGFDSSF